MESGVYNDLVDVCSVNGLRIEPHYGNVGKTVVDSLFADNVLRSFSFCKLHGTLRCRFCKFGDWLVNREVLQTAYDVLAGGNISILTADGNVVVGVVRRERLYD